MKNIISIGRETTNVSIGIVCLAGLVLAIADGLNVITYGNMSLILDGVFASVIALLVYFHQTESEHIVVAVALALWALISSTVALFVGFFAIMDNPAVVSDAPWAIEGVVTNISDFVLTTAVLSGLYGIAANFGLRGLVVLAPLTQTVALVVSAYLIPIIAGLIS